MILNKLKLILTAVFGLLASGVSAYDFESEGIYYNITSEENRTVEVTTGDYQPVYSGDVVIPEKVTHEGTEYTVVAIGRNAFLYCTDLSSVELPNSLTSIRFAAFSGCSSLTSIDLPESVTTIEQSVFLRSGLAYVNIPIGLKEIGALAFSSYDTIDVHIKDIEAWYNIDFTSTLEYIDEPGYYDGPTFFGGNGFRLYLNNTEITEPFVPDTATKIKIGPYMGCMSLSSFEIREGVTHIDSAFINCGNLLEVKIPNSVKTMNRAFIGCSSLSAVNIPDGVEAFDFAFCGTNLSSAVIPDGVTSIDGTFAKTPIASIDIPASVKSMNYAFMGCENITSFVIPSTVDSMKWAFLNCINLTSITFPDDITVIQTGILDNCASLTSVDIPKGVTKIEDLAFAGCENLTSIELPEGLTYIGRSGFLRCEALTSIDIPDNVTYIGSRAFSMCGSLVSIKIPEGVSIINPSTFSSCSSLASVDVPDGITIIGESAFASCGSLKSIEIPKSVTTIEKQAFSGCYSLPSITIPDKVTYIGEEAFNGCTGFTSLTIPDNVTYICKRAFTGCTNLITVTVGEDIPTGNTVTMEQWVFGNCWNLKEVIFADVFSNYQFFSGCSELTSVTILRKFNAMFGYDSDLKTLRIGAGVTEIKPGAFGGCNALEELIIDDGTGRMSVSNEGWDYCPLERVYMGRDFGAPLYNNTIREIVVGDSARTMLMFGADVYSDLDSLVIGKNVETVPAFTRSWGLRTVVVNSETPMVAEGFSDGTYSAATLYVPAGSSAAYKETDVWKNFYNIKEMDDGTAIGSIVADKAPATETGRYDASGRKICAPRRGLNIVRMSDGTVRKIVVR